MSSTLGAHNNSNSDIPWVYPNAYEFDHISATQLSLGGQSSSSENSSTYCEYSSTYFEECQSYPVSYPSLESQYPSSGYMSGPQDLMEMEQTTPMDHFGLNSVLGDPLDCIQSDATLTTINSPIPQITPTLPCFELTDLSHCYKRRENLSPAPSPVPQCQPVYTDEMWQVDTFADIEVFTEDPDNLADIYSRIDLNSNIHCNSNVATPSPFDNSPSLPNITSMLPNPLTPSMPPQCKTEAPMSGTFPSSSPKKPKTHSTRQRRGKQPTLWQFLYYALEHPQEYKSMISWVDQPNGVFEFSSKNKDSLARAWGEVKNNRCKMTYPKLARALRKYIEGQKYLTKRKRKLQYVFLPDFLQELRNGTAIRPLSASDQAKMYKCSREQYH